MSALTLAPTSTSIDDEWAAMNASSNKNFKAKNRSTTAGLISLEKRSKKVKFSKNLEMTLHLQKWYNGLITRKHAKDHHNLKLSRPKRKPVPRLLVILSLMILFQTS